MCTRHQEAIDRLREAEEEVDRLTEKLVDAVGGWYHRGDDASLAAAFKMLMAAHQVEEDAASLLMSMKEGE